MTDRPFYPVTVTVNGVERLRNKLVPALTHVIAAISSRSRTSLCFFFVIIIYFSLKNAACHVMEKFINTF